MIEYFRVLFLRNPKSRLIIVVREHRPMTTAIFELASISKKYPKSAGQVKACPELTDKAGFPVRRPMTDRRRPG